jgi:hypothetical protein
MLPGGNFLGDVEVSQSGGTPKSSMFIGFVGFCIIKQPFWGSPIYGNPHSYTN